MKSTWYPIAFSVVLTGCGGDVDSGSPAKTDGIFVPPYGPIPIYTGGSVGIGGGPGVGGQSSFGGVTASSTACPTVVMTNDPYAGLPELADAGTDACSCPDPTSVGSSCAGDPPACTSGYMQQLCLQCFGFNSPNTPPGFPVCNPVGLRCSYPIAIDVHCTCCPSDAGTGTWQCGDYHSGPCY